MICVSCRYNYTPKPLASWELSYTWCPGGAAGAFAPAAPPALDFIKFKEIATALPLAGQEKKVI